MSALAPPGAPAPPNGESAAFAEPWQVEAFALTVALNQKGLFDWPEWVATFAGPHADAAGAVDGVYYERWLAALETILQLRGLVGAPEIDRRVAQWRRAYLRTPHGQPVDLARGLEGE